MSDINMTPLVDVMLVLVVIFIITAPLLVSAVKVDLPKAESGQMLDAPKSIGVAIDKAGQVFIDDLLQTPDTLALALQSAALRNPSTEVQLRADTAVPYGKVVEVMGAAQKAGLNRIGFVADAPLPAPVPEAVPAR